MGLFHLLHMIKPWGRSYCSKPSVFQSKILKLDQFFFVFFSELKVISASAVNNQVPTESKCIRHNCKCTMKKNLLKNASTGLYFRKGTLQTATL